MFNFAVKKGKGMLVSTSLGKRLLPIIGVLEEEDVKKLIHLNLLDTCCFKIPHVFKKDDIVVVTKEPTFDICEYDEYDEIKFQEREDVGETKIISHVFSNEVTVRLEGDFHSRSTSGIRPATKEEIEIFKKERSKKK